MDERQVAAIVARVVAEIDGRDDWGDSADDLRQAVDGNQTSDASGRENTEMTKAMADEIKAKIAAARSSNEIMEILGDHVPTTWNREGPGADVQWVRFRPDRHDG